MNVGERMGTTTTQDIVLLGTLTLGAYLVYNIIQGFKKTAQFGQDIYKGLQTATMPISDAIAAAWIHMTGLSGGSSMKLLGNVLFPDGTYTPIGQLTVKSDALGNVYVYQQGRLFQLQPSDINGDWPASEITDLSQIGKAPI